MITINSAFEKEIGLLGNRVEKAIYIFYLFIFHNRVYIFIIFFAFRPVQIIFKAYVAFQNRHEKSEHLQILEEIEF